MVKESGLDELNIRSDKPGAVAFHRWVTGEMLPKVRKRLAYKLLKEREEVCYGQVLPGLRGDA